MTIIDYNRCSY